MVAYTCNPSTLGGQAGSGSCDQKFKTSLTNIMKPCLFSQVWCQVPVISATREAEAEELLEPGRRRLQ